MEKELEALRAEREVLNRALLDVRQELAATLERYDDLFQHLPIGCLTLTTSGYVVQANPTAASWLRMDLDRLQGSSFRQFLNAFDAGRFAAHLETCQHCAAGHSLEITLRLENNVVLTVQMTSRFAPSSGTSEPYIHTALTHISKVQQAQALTDDIRLEQDAITRSIADALKSPLSTISRFARQLVRDHGDTLPSETREVIERMECAAFRMETNQQELLELCFLQRDDFVSDPVNLDEIVQQVILEFRGMIQRRHASITVKRPLPCVRGPRLALATVLATILVRILRKSTADQPASVVIFAERKSEEVELNFDCEGIATTWDAGKDPQTADEVELGCDLFGAHLELAVIRRNIERMNGKIHLTSGVGKSPRVSVSLSSV